MAIDVTAILTDRRRDTHPPARRDPPPREHGCPVRIFGGVGETPAVHAGRGSGFEALPEGAYIPYLVLDQNMSVLEGSLGILPRRVLVDDQCLKSARRLLEDAGLARELRPDVG